MKRVATELFALLNLALVVDLSADSLKWAGSWATTLYEPGATRKHIAFGVKISDRTVRNIIRPSLAGSVGRLRLSNISGRTVARFDGVFIADQKGAGSDVGPDQPVYFDGQSSVWVPAGRVVYSDAFHFRISPQRKLAVSFHVKEASLPSVHPSAAQTNFISTPGDHSAEASGGAFTIAQPVWFFLDRLDVEGLTASIIAIGDSITAGCANTRDVDHRWPDYLANQLATVQPRGVLNLGVNGNCLAYDSECFGEAVVHRVARVLDEQSHIDSLVILAGANDLIQPAIPRSRENSDCLVSSSTGVQPLTAALNHIIRDAQIRQVRVILGTITPCGNFAHWSAELEAERQKLNDWIRHISSAQVVDFDALLRDPKDGAKLRADYDSGDGLHPNDKAAEVMGMAAARLFSIQRVGTPLLTPTSKLVHPKTASALSAFGSVALHVGRIGE